MPYRGCFEEGPMVLFKSSLEDVKKSFWLYARNFVFPELEKNMMEGFESLMNFDKRRAADLHDFLCGKDLTLKKFTFLCRVHPDQVRNQKDARELVEFIFSRKYRGQGFFQDTFMKLDYRIDPDSLRVKIVSSRDLHEKYSIDIPSNSFVFAYKTVLDIQFDVTIRLLKEVLPLDFNDVGDAWYYSEHEPSVYSVMRLILEHPDDVILERIFRRCRRKPRNEEEADRNFLENLFRENPANMYLVAQLLKDFSGKKDVASRIALLPSFEPENRWRDCYRFFERHVLNTLQGKGSYSFDCSLSIAFSGSVGYFEALGILERMSFFLGEQIQECRKVMLSPRFQIPYDWGDIHMMKIGGNEIRIKLSDPNRAYLKKNEGDIPAVRDFLQEFSRRLEELRDAICGLREAISSVSSFHLQNAIGDMVIRTVKLDPVTYCEHPIGAIRNYAFSMMA